MSSLQNPSKLVFSVLASFVFIVTTAGRPAATTSTDIAIKMHASRATVKPGQNVTYTITMTNLGPRDATSAFVEFSVSAQLRVVSWTCDQGISADGSLCEYSSLPTGKSVVSRLVVTPASLTALQTRVVTTSATAGFENAGDTDPHLHNNHASVQTTIIGSTSHP